MTWNGRMDPQSAAEKAVSVIGFGYDLTNDVRLSYCKPGPYDSRLIELDQTLTRDLVVPGGVLVRNVPEAIKCLQGVRTRSRSDLVCFDQMSEKFNQEFSLSGKIPSGLFNIMFDFQGCWPIDRASTKTLGFDGWFISLYNIKLERSQIVLCEHIVQEVPSTWDPVALAGFIQKYGTHVILGVKMGGKDIIHIKQLANSCLQSSEVQKLLEKLVDERFSDVTEGNKVTNDLRREYKEEQFSTWEYGELPVNQSRSVILYSKKEDLVTIHVRRGGRDEGQIHKQWLSTISESPDVISLSLVPIASLLNGVPGGGYLMYAMNLYLRSKPPLEELHQFLQFQLPRQWAPVYGDLLLGQQFKKPAYPFLKFSFLGPKLYVNTAQVTSGDRPVTGMHLHLEGKKCNHLSLHLQHLSRLPEILQLSRNSHCVVNDDNPIDPLYYEPVKSSFFSHVCTHPVRCKEDAIGDLAPIVTKAWLEVNDFGTGKKVLFLRLGFSLVSSARIWRSEWDGSVGLSRKSVPFSMMFSSMFSVGLGLSQKRSNMDSKRLPKQAKAPKLARFVDTKQVVRGPEDLPGYWVVTGGKLCVEGAKISLRVKYSLLAKVSEGDL